MGTHKNVIVRITFPPVLSSLFLWSTMNNFKNGFQNRAPSVSLQFVGFQLCFQVLGAALLKYGESSVIQQSKSFLLSSNLSKMKKNFCWALSFIIEHILTDPRQSNFLSLNFDILDFDRDKDQIGLNLCWHDQGQCSEKQDQDQGEVKSNS